MEEREHRFIAPPTPRLKGRRPLTIIAIYSDPHGTVSGGDF
jgi:hypothetical protein